MVTLEECLVMCDLDEITVEAIAAHEHLTLIAALELGQCLLSNPVGVECLRQVLQDEIERARIHNHVHQAIPLRDALAHLDAAFPQATGVTPQLAPN
ncbi:MAG: hypothetical protein ACFCBW_06915 [Candidatus Competibacterales bacterium]